jgi:hypothetical protein
MDWCCSSLVPLSTSSHFRCFFAIKTDKKWTFPRLHPPWGRRMSGKIKWALNKCWLCVVRLCVSIEIGFSGLLGRKFLCQIYHVFVYAFMFSLCLFSFLKEFEKNVFFSIKSFIFNINCQLRVIVFVNLIIFMLIMEILIHSKKNKIFTFLLWAVERAERTRSSRRRHRPAWQRQKTYLDEWCHNKFHIGFSSNLITLRLLAYP